MRYSVSMYISRIPNRSSPAAILLRESYREEGKVKTRTLANLSKLPGEAISLLKRFLRGERFVCADEAFQCVDSWHHGHVQAVRDAMEQLGFDRLISPRACPERDRVLAMVSARILAPESKLATTRWWDTTTLPRLLALGDTDEDDLYATMDWLLERQERIEATLAKRHLREDALVLYDLSSSYFEGSSCPLAALGHSRDGKKGKLQVNYGLLTDDRGCPVAVSVCKGNTVDTQTLLPQVERIQGQFGIERLAIVGDRGMISQTQIDELKSMPGVDWVTALRSSAIHRLVDTHQVQLDLFDERSYFQLTHPDYPGERLVACRNPLLAEHRAKKRQALLQATTRELEAIQALLERAKLRGSEKIARRVKRIIGPCGLAEHFTFAIDAAHFAYRLLDPDGAAAALLSAFEQKLEQARARIVRGTLRGRAEIEARLTSIAKQHKLDEQVVFDIGEAGFSYRFPDQSAALKGALDGVCQALERIRVFVEQGKFGGRDKIGIRLGKVVNKYKVGKHFVLDIRDEDFAFRVDAQKVAEEAALDGIYIIRTSVDTARMSAAQAVRSYKSLSQVERAFRSIKTVDLKVRPIHHHLEPRVRAHLFLCMLAYYVEWHMREAWRPLLFCDEDLEAKAQRDPVTPAERSDTAMDKVHTKTLEDGSPAHSFQSLLQALSGIVLNIAQVPGTFDDIATFEIVTTPNPTQQRAMELLKKIQL
jgi:transposase